MLHLTIFLVFEVVGIDIEEPNENKISYRSPRRV